MAFVDEVQLHIKAGNGGDGVVRWRKEKFKPKGGPCGGNGGKGGDVYAEAVVDLGYLDHYLHTKHFSANSGESGGNSSKEGKNGDDLILKFPRGTVLKNTITGESHELVEVGQTIKILEGGRGGLGNEYFKSSTNTTPYEWTPGSPGEEADFHIELKLFADIGFVGLPSAGKSTLLNALTNAQSKVGAYHFTTLDPHLGDMHGYILADIPGIIEG
ncbi:50S ribosome-binding GTPase, partial [Patescibacteria group bacterium]|nr:50S ribosome-binding GTPase [Patescibacteria group bacterium]